jgi:hypothetical protein
VNFSTDQWKGIYLVKWEGITNSDASGAPFACPSYPIKSVQVTGTWGGAQLTIYGSNIPETPTYYPLNNGSGNTLTFVSNGLRDIRENTYWVRPYVSGGDATTDLDVYLLCVTER